tara:strand:+ start:1706 stop:2002 length:297 start_codon:yes stop_codon:yes gene_type:complete
MSEKKIWLLGQLLAIATFFVVSAIIFLILKIFVNIFPDTSYLQVCAVHLIWRILRADLPVEIAPMIFQHKKTSEVNALMSNIEKEMEKLNLDDLIPKK